MKTSRKLSYPIWATVDMKIALTNSPTPLASNVRFSWKSFSGQSNGEPVFSARARQRNDVKNTKNASEFVVWEKISGKFIVAEVFLLFKYSILFEEIGVPGSDFLLAPRGDEDAYCTGLPSYVFFFSALHPRPSRSLCRRYFFHFSKTS